MYDVIVIGGGPGGYTAAIRGAQVGLKVALIERNKLGGTCLNVGCIPTKSLLSTSKTYHKLSSVDTLGINVDNISYSLEDIYKKKDETVTSLVDGVRKLVEGNLIDYFEDSGSFVDEHHILLKNSNEVIEGKNIIIATGSKPRGIPFEGSTLSRVLNSDDVLSNPIDVKDVCILGGGVIGVEFADFYSDLGCNVTIIESEKQILSTLDRELSLSAQAYLKGKGVKLLTGSMLERCEETDSFKVYYSKDEGLEYIECDALIVAVGRIGNTEGLDLDKIGIETSRSYIEVNDEYQTKISNIYSIGDVSGSIQLAHVASTQGKHVIESIIGKSDKHNELLVPYCIYTGIEISYVGLSEKEAKDKGLEVTTKKLLMNTNGRHLIETTDRSFMKVVVSDNKIIGAQLFCKQATELISYFTMAIKLELTLDELESIIFPHPTISEAVGEAFESISDKAIHQLVKRR